MIKHALIESIKISPKFEKLFPIKPETLRAITEHMKEHGYDDSKPIDIWQGVVIDGHTRLEAAKACKLETVPVFDHDELETEDDAVSYAIHNQRDRRNITDADLAIWVAEIDRRKKQGEGQDRGEDGKYKPKASTDAIGIPKKKSAKETADVVGTSRAKVERFRMVQERAGEEAIERIKAGESTIHAEYQKVKQPKQEKPIVADVCNKKPNDIKIDGAMHFARLAIAQLRCITTVYSDAMDAFDHTTKWIEKRRESLK